MNFQMDVALGGQAVTGPPLISQSDHERIANGVAMDIDYARWSPDLEVLQPDEARLTD